MIAPEVVVVERLELRVDGNYCGTGSVERDRTHVVAANTRVGQCGARCLGKGTHVRRVRLRGEVGIFAFANDRILGDPNAKSAAHAVDDRDANTLGAKIHSGDDRHALAQMCR